MGKKEHYSGGGEKTIIKSVILRKYMTSYLNILESNWYGDCWYIGTHSGTGYTREMGVDIPGSVIRALNDDFDRYYFHEKDPDRFKTLVDTVSEEVDQDISIEHQDGVKTAISDDQSISVRNEDCNEGVKKLINETNKFNHWFVFIDPEGMTMYRDTVEEICNRGHVDILFNFQTEGYYRNLSKGATHSEGKLKRCLGENHPQSVTSKDELVQWYKKDVFEELEYNTASKSLRSNDPNNNWRYDLIFASQADVAEKIIKDIYKGNLDRDVTDQIKKYRKQSECAQTGLEQHGIRIESHDEQSSIDNWT